MSMIKTLLAVSAVAMVTQHVQCDVAWMRQALTDHFSRSRHMIYPGNRSDAQEFIKNQFKGLNLELHLHTYTASLYDQNGTFTAVNIIGILKGKYFNTTDDTIIAIGAHYDTVAEGPGVNDNGAGVVVMLEAARTLAAHGQGHRNTTVLFIAFDLEEYSNGSAVLVRDWMPTLKGWQSGWKGIFVVDTVLNFDETEQAQRLPIGTDMLFPDVAARIAADKYKGNFIVAMGRKVLVDTVLMDTELLAKFNKSWFEQGNLKYKIAVIAVPKEVFDSGQSAALERSDHKFFWKANKEAVFLTDTVELRGYMQECYHQQCDDSSHITDANLQFALQLANSLADVINTYAPADPTSSSGRLTLSIAVLLATTMISINWSLVRRGID